MIINWHQINQGLSLNYQGERTNELGFKRGFLVEIGAIEQIFYDSFCQKTEVIGAPKEHE